jgi:putative ABC transport system substrate-binding protein
MKKKFFNRALCAMLSALCFFGALLFALCVPAQAQQTNKIYRVGYLSGRSGFEAPEEAFRQGLREHGYVEGRNIVVEWRFASFRQKDRIRKHADELVRLNVDCIVTTTTLTTRVAKKATSTIPIVMTNVGDPVQRGIVASLAQPGGNITGLSTLNPDLAGKRMELLKESFPHISRVAALWNPSRKGNDAHFRGTATAARKLGVQLQSLEVQGRDDFESAFRAAVKARADALSQMGCCFWTYRARIFDFAKTHRLPVMYSALRFVRAGGLMAYAPDRVDQFRRAATYVDKILRGAKPADLPVEGPKKFALVINLKAAKQIGVTFPSELLYRADKLIK